MFCTPVTQDGNKTLFISAKLLLSSLEEGLKPENDASCMLSFKACFVDHREKQLNLVSMAEYRGELEKTTLFTVNTTGDFPAFISY